MHPAPWVPLLGALLLLPAPAGGEDGPPNFPLPPAEAERRLGEAPFEIAEAERTASGVAGAMKMRLRFEDGAVLEVKWKTAPAGSGEGFNNSPRKELAAYEVQKLFLDPEDYVVPTTVVRCIPLERFRAVEPDAAPSFAGTRCVFGAFALWLEDVRPADQHDIIPRPTPAQPFRVDEALFREDEDYAESIGNVNVLGILIDHRDGRRANFLLAAGDGGRRVYAIDNGISFGGLVYNYLVPNWNQFRVPALPEDALERLFELKGRDVLALGVMAELHASEGGVLRAVEPGPNLDPESGTRVAEGVVQLGLSRDEIQGLAGRLNRLLQDVETGAVPVLDD